MYTVVLHDAVDVSPKRALIGQSQDLLPRQRAVCGMRASVHIDAPRDHPWVPLDLHKK